MNEIIALASEILTPTYSFPWMLEGCRDAVKYNAINYINNKNMRQFGVAHEI